MSVTMDPVRAYRILGLAPSASRDEVKAAYRDLVQVWHPDRFPADSRLRAKAERNLQRINAAYEALKHGPPVASAAPARARSRGRGSVADLFGIGDVRDSAVLQAPVRALRQSLRVLGLDLPQRRPARRRRVGTWLLASVVLLALAVLAGTLLRER